MSQEHTSLKFQNVQNPNIGFELLRLEELYQNKSFDRHAGQLHLVEFFIIIFITEGNGEHTIDFNSYECERGTILTIRKDQIHKFSKSSSLKGFLLFFTEEFVISYLEKLEAQKSLQLFNESLGAPKLILSEAEMEEISQLVKRIGQEYFLINDSHSTQIIRSELQVLIVKLHRFKAKSHNIIAEKQYLSEFIELQGLAEKNVSTTTKVMDYANMMGVSTKTLNTITQHIVNQTAKDFIDQVCILQIKRLLINTTYSIKEISFKAGFEETTNFYKYFKRKTGITPETFRTTF